MSRLTRDGTVVPVSRDKILSRKRGQENIYFTCSSVNHEQDWQSYPVGQCSAVCDEHTYMMCSLLFRNVDILLEYSDRYMIHGSFSSRSTIRIWVILCFVYLTPTQVSSVGANVGILCLSDRPRMRATATLNNISVFILVWHVFTSSLLL